MNLKHALKVAERYVIDNSPAIATAVGVTGVIATAVLSGKASIKAYQIIESEQNADFRETNRVEDFTVREKIELVWKCYIPPAIAGTLTIAAIIAANRIGARRAAAVAAAYTISEKAWNEYRDKVVEIHGEKNEQKVRDAVAQDRVRRNAEKIDREVIMLGEGEQVFLDAFSGRTFKSDRETLRKLENDYNERIVNGFGEVILLSELYDDIGLRTTDYSREVGWNLDNRVSFNFSVTEHKGKAVCVLGYNSWPIREYSKS